MFEDETEILLLYTIRGWFQRGVLNSNKSLILKDFVVDPLRILIQFVTNGLDYTLNIPFDEEEFILYYTTTEGKAKSVSFTAEQIIKGHFPT